VARRRTAGTARRHSSGSIMHSTRRILSFVTLPCVLLAAGAAVAPAQEVLEPELGTEYQDIRLVRVASGIEHPWGIAFLPAGRILVTERGGRLHIVEGGRRTLVTGAPPVHARNQGGLLDAVVHPQHAQNGWIYFTYSTGTGDSTTTALGRARLDGMRLVGFEQLFVARAWGGAGMHYGSRIAFLPDGTLLMSVGDRFREPMRAQDPNDHAGTILRLRDDGTVPPDNPGAGIAGRAAEVYSYGHRNVQALTVHPVTHDVWIVDHGPRGSDVVHRVVPGGNHGWPVASRGREYRTQEPLEQAADAVPAGVVAPVHEFVWTLAPSGLTAVRGGGWAETWQGNLIVGGLRGQRLLRLVIEDGALAHAEELLIHRIGRIRDVRQAPDGNIYIATDEEDGGIYRIEPAG
jgi:aldose sugar dehydrogenase